MSTTSPIVLWLFLAATACVLRCCHGEYKVTSIEAGSFSSLTAVGQRWEATLEWSGAVPAQFAGLGAPISPLTALITARSADTVRVHISDPFVERWEVPDVLQPAPSAGSSSGIKLLYNVQLPALNAAFQYKVTRSSSNDAGGLGAGEVVFDSSPETFFFADQFLQVVTPLSPNSVQCRLPFLMYACCCCCCLGNLNALSSLPPASPFASTLPGLVSADSAFGCTLLVMRKRSSS